MDPTPISMLTDSKGQTWLGFTNNRLGKLSSTGIQILPQGTRRRIGNVLSLHEYDGRLLLGGDLGLTWFDGSQMREIVPADSDHFRGVSGIVADGQANLWLHGSAGLIRINAHELARFWSEPAKPLGWEVFNYEDGLRGASAKIRPLPSISFGAGGKVYYATVEGVGWIDPGNIRRNPVAPQVVFETLVANGRPYLPVSGLALPERTNTLDIRFTAPSLSIPERVRLRYKLDTVDADWRDGPRSAPPTTPIWRPAIIASMSSPPTKMASGARKVRRSVSISRRRYGKRPGSRYCAAAWCCSDCGCCTAGASPPLPGARSCGHRYDSMAW